jgi:hypothetical protein
LIQIVCTENTLVSSVPGDTGILSALGIVSQNNPAECTTVTPDATDFERLITRIAAKRGSFISLADSHFDRTLYRLERGELVVRTDPVDWRGGGDPHLGYAVLAGTFLVTAATLTFHDRPYEIPAPVVAGGSLLGYLVRRRAPS